MLLIVHIIFALGSLILSAYASVHASKSSINVARAAAALMLTSGVLLTIQHPAHLAQSCLTGIAMLGIIGTMLVRARQKIAE